MNIRIRQVMPEDLDAVARVEAVCFTEAEAAARASFEQRIRTFPESFFVAERMEKSLDLLMDVGQMHRRSVMRCLMM